MWLEKATKSRKNARQLVNYRQLMVFLSVTVCEIKYTQAKTNTHVIDEMEKKLALFQQKKHYTLHRVLISAAGAEEALINRAYFDDILTLEDLC